MSHLLHRNLRSTPLQAVGGRGVELFGADGKTYIDASGGAAVSCLGHQHPRVLAALHGQLDRLAYAHTGYFTSEAAEALADLLIEDAPGDLTRVFLVSSGSEAVEAALKMARQYRLEDGQPERRHIISRRLSYHGATLGALAAGGNAGRRAPFEPLLLPTHAIEPCFEYRFRAPEETVEDYAARTAQALEDKILELGPQTVLAFIAEPVVGATTGATPPVGDYLRRVREICDRHGVLLIFDEVMCGMGRTGWRYACQEWGVAPDLLTVAKGLGGGYQPTGAVLLSNAIFKRLRDGSGAFQHGHTFGAHPMAAAAALAVQTIVREDDLIANVRVMGDLLEKRLRERLSDNAFVGDIRGRGLFRGVELVADRESKTPFDPKLKMHARLKAEAFARGLIVYPMGGTVDGVNGDHILLAPPFIVSRADIERIVDLLGDSIESATTL